MSQDTVTDRAAPLQMTTTEARPGGKAPARIDSGWHYTAEWFAPGQHTPGTYRPGQPRGQLADVYMRDGCTFALDLDLYKPDEAAAYAASALAVYLASRAPYVTRDNEPGSQRHLIVMTPEQAADWWPVAGKIPGGEIRSAGLGPSPGSTHPSGGQYAHVPGPDPVGYPDGTVLMTNRIAFDDELKAALIAGGAHGADDRDMVPGDAELPDDDGRCERVAAWLADPEHLNSTTPRGSHANAAVNYLKRLDAEGHRVGGWIGEVTAALPETAPADFAAMWATAPVPADTEYREAWDCCHPNPLRDAVTAMGQQQQRAALNGQQAPAQQQALPSLLARVKGGAYLNGTTFAPLHYHIDGLVPEGLTVLTGAPKIGKSWLVLGWLLTLAGQGKAVLYLALEDSDRRMQWRCRRLLGGAPVPEAFSYMTEEDMVPGMLLPTVAQFAAESYARQPLIVLDTLGKALQQAPRGRDEAAYERDYRVTSELQRAVKDVPGAGLVICHHDRKAGSGDWVDKASGTKGITGGPDALLYLERRRAEIDGTLHVTGRDIAEDDYAMTFADACRWTFDGGTLAAAAGAYLARQARSGLGDRSAQIVAYVTAGGGVRAADVAAEMDISEAQAKVYLKRLCDANRIKRAERGRYVGVSYVISPAAQGAVPLPNNVTNTIQSPPRARAASPPPDDPPPGNPPGCVRETMARPPGIGDEQFETLHAVVCAACAAARS